MTLTVQDVDQLHQPLHLHDAPCPRDEDNDDEAGVWQDGPLVEGGEEVGDVGRRAEVDEEQRRQLVAGEVSLRQQPAAEYDDNEKRLLQHQEPVVVVHRDGRVLGGGVLLWRQAETENRAKTSIFYSHL